MLRLIISSILLKGYYSLFIEHNDIGVIELVDPNEPTNTRTDQQEQEDLLRRRLMPGGLTNQDKLSILNAHNNYRARTAQGLTYGQPSSSNMNELIWDAGLAQVAQDYSAQCIWAHNSNRNTDLLKHLDITSFDYTNQVVGENLFISSGSESIDVILQGIQYWYEEYTYFTYGAISSTGSTCQSGQQCGHYTQVVWGNTRYVGCGYTKCPSTSGLSISGAVLFVCNYYFPGNVVGYHPYNTGSPATGCGADRTPNNNLCSGCPNPTWDKYCCQYCSTTECVEAEASNLLNSVATCTNGLGVELSSGSSGPAPTSRPSNNPTPSPTPRPSNYPTPRPSNYPTPRPSNYPTPRPSHNPTPSPTPRPSNYPTPLPTTASPTTASPTTASPTTASPTTASPTTASPTTASPTTSSPTTASPTTASPTTSSSTTASPTTSSPTTSSPTTASPTTASPTTSSPTAGSSTSRPQSSTLKAYLIPNAHSSRGCCKALNSRYTNFCTSIETSNTCETYSGLCSWYTSC